MARIHVQAPHQGGFGGHSFHGGQPPFAQLLRPGGCGRTWPCMLKSIATGSSARRGRAIQVVIYRLGAIGRLFFPNGTMARIVVPLPGEDTTLNRPPTISTRSRMPVNPRRLFHSGDERRANLKALPLSATSRHTQPPALRRDTFTMLARACLATLMSASWATR